MEIIFELRVWLMLPSVGLVRTGYLSLTGLSRIIKVFRYVGALEGNLLVIGH